MTLRDIPPQSGFFRERCLIDRLVNQLPGKAAVKADFEIIGGNELMV